MLRSTHFSQAISLSLSCSVMALVLALIYCGVRWGLVTDYAAVLRTIGLSFLFLNGSVITAPRLIKRVSSLSLYSAIAVNVLLLFTMVMLAGNFLPAVVLSIASWGVTGLGFTSFAGVLYCWFRQSKKWGDYLILLLWIIFSVWVGLKVWGAEYLSPLFLENIATGSAHADTLFHISLASMLRTYQHVSLGVNGLTYLPYHFGSHWLLAALANVLQVTVLNVYNLSYPIVFLPLLFFVFLNLVFEMKKFLKQTKYHRLFFWGLFFISLIGLIPFQLQNKLMLDQIIFFSESQTIGLIFFLLTIHGSILITDWRPRMYWLFLLSIVALFTGLIKISFLYLLLAGTSYVYVRLSGWKKLQFSLMLVGFVAISFWLYQMVRLPDHMGPAQPLALFLSLQGVYRIGWIMFGFWPLWLYILARLKEKDIYKLSEFWETVRNREMVDVEVLTVFTVAGLLPGNIWALPGNNGNYFIDASQWLVLVMLLGRSEQVCDLLMEVGRKWRVGTLALIVIVGITFFNFFGAAKWFITLHGFRRQAMMDVYGSTALVTATKNKEQAAFLLELEPLSQQPLAEKRQQLIKVPQNSELWQSPLRCDIQPLVVPAVAEVVLFNELPQTTCPYKLPGYSR